MAEIGETTLMSNQTEGACLQPHERGLQLPQKGRVLVNLAPIGLYIARRDISPDENLQSVKGEMLACVLLIASALQPHMSRLQSPKTGKVLVNWLLPINIQLPRLHCRVLRSPE